MLARLLTLSIILSIVYMPGVAFADTLGVDECNTLHGGVFQEWHYTGKVVYCIKASVISAVGSVMTALSNYMTGVVAAMITFAIMAHGIKILSGERELKRKTIGFFIKMGLVLLFSYNLNGWAGLVFGVMDQLILLVAGVYDPWIAIDTFLGKLFGFGETIVLFQGIMGIVGGALFSSTVGVFLFLAGFLAILDVMMFIFRAVFMYLTAVVMIAFMLVISPLIIPTALFFYTERYFKVWLDKLIAAILVPVIMFAFLSMFLGIFDVLIGNILAILTPNPDDPDFRAFWKLNQPMFSWLMPMDPNTAVSLEDVTDTGNKSAPAVQANVTPTLRRAFNANVMNMPGINFGSNDIFITQALIFAFITLWIFASLMKSMLAKIPNIADDIAGAASRITMQPTGIENTFKQFKQNVTSGASPLQGILK